MQLTDGLADAVSPAFDAGGKYLYFLASTDYGPRTGWVEMSAVDRPVRRTVYLAVLSNADASPFLPESGDEPAAPAAPKSRTDSIVRIDAGINQRIVSLDIPPGDYTSLSAGPAGSFFYMEPAAAPGALRLQKYQLKERMAATFLDGIRSYTVSRDGKQLLYSAGGGANARWASCRRTGRRASGTAR